MKCSKPDCFNRTRRPAFRGGLSSPTANVPTSLSAVLWAICILAGSAHAARAQAPGTGAIAGTVTDPSGAVVGGHLSGASRSRGCNRRLLRPVRLSHCFENRGCRRRDGGRCVLGAIRANGPIAAQTAFGECGRIIAI